jgi:hypothetical protein
MDGATSGPAGEFRARWTRDLRPATQTGQIERVQSLRNPETLTDSGFRPAKILPNLALKMQVLDPRGLKR